MRKPRFPYVKTKTQISFAVTAKLISAFVFATWIVQYLFFLNTKFPASSHLQWLYSLVSVRPDQNTNCWFSHAGAQLRIVGLKLCSFNFEKAQMSRDMKKPTMWILTRSDTNQAVQPLEMARVLKFCI